MTTPGLQAYGLRSGSFKAWGHTALPGPAASTGYYAPPSLSGYTVVNYSSISGATGSNFAATLAAVSSPTVIRLDPDTDYYIGDFTMGASSTSGYGCYAPNVVGLICDGTTDPTKRARVHQSAGSMSSSSLAKVPAQSTKQVNNLWSLRIAGGTDCLYYGIVFTGHDQQNDPNTGLPAAYNGLQMYTPGANTKMAWCRFRGFGMATWNSPPGETNMLSTYNGAGMNLYQVEADGHNGDGTRSGGAFSANGCAAVYWEDVYVHDTAVSGVTFSTASVDTGSLHTLRLKVRNNANHSSGSGQTFPCVNHEGVDGPILHESPDLLSPLDYSSGYAATHFYFGNQSTNASSVQITNPVWNAVSESGAYGALVVQVNQYYPSGTTLNKQTTVPTVTLNGTTMTAVNKTAATSSINPSTQFVLKTA